MIRRLFTVAAGLSLGMGVAAGVGWGVSYRRPLAFEFVRRDGLLWEVAARKGQFSLDTSPQYRLDLRSSEYVGLQFIKALRASSPLQQRYSETFKLRQDGKITRDEWERYLRESEAERDEATSRWRRIYSQRPALPPTPVVHSVRCAPVAAGSAALPTIWLASWLLSRQAKAMRKGQNRCIPCGYDLRASRDRCPECGTPISAIEHNTT